MKTMGKKFSGSLVALVTPMMMNGEIDYSALKRLIDWHLNSGSHGLVVMGTTGESSLLSRLEQLEVIRFTLEQVNGRIPVIAGCGSISTSGTVELVRQINALSVDGFLCVTPYYVKPSQPGLVLHFQAVADQCEAPLILYNVPGRTACDLKNETVMELARHPNIVGIKDAVGDIVRSRQLFELVGDDFIYLSGDDETAFDFVAAGGDGVISVTANIAPELMAEWNRLLLAGDCSETDYLRAKSIFDKLMPLHQKLFVEANPSPAKWALNQMGFIPQGIRLPLTMPTQTSQQLIGDALRQSIDFN